LVIIFLFLAILIGGRLFYVAETGNISNYSKQKIINFLKEKGVNIDFQRLSYSINSGFTLHDVVIRDSYEDDAFFIQASQIAIKTNFWDDPESYMLKSVKVEKALASLYLKDRAEPIHIRDIKLNLNIKPETLQFAKSSLTLKRLNLEYGGNIVLSQKKSASKPSSKSEILQKVFTTIKTNLKQFDSLKETHKTSVKHFLELPAINLSVIFNIPLDTPEKVNIKTKFHIPAHNVRGIQIDELSGKVSYSSDTIKIEDGLIQIDKDEFIKVDAEHNLKTSETKCSGDINLYPERVATFLIGYSPTVTKFANFIKSSGEPVSIKYEIPKQVIKPDTFTINAKVAAKDLTYDKDLQVNQLYGDVVWDSKSLSFKCKDLIFNNSAKGDCDGVLFTKPLSLLLRGDVTGNPRFAWKFMGEKAQEVYLMICDWFTWEEKSPSRVNFLMQTNFDNFYMRSDISMSNFKFHNKPVKQINTGLNLAISDEEDYMVMHNTSVITEKNNIINGNLAYEFHNDDNEILFDAVSTEPPADIFELMDLKDIAGTFDFVKFTKPLHYNVSGNFDFNSPESSDINADIIAKEVDLKGYVINDATANFSFDNNKLSVSNIKGKFGGGPAEGFFEYDLTSDKSAVDANIKDFNISAIPIIGEKGSGKGEVALAVGMQFFDDKPVQVSGSGKGTIKEAKVWQMPILTSLANVMGTILPTKGLGEITEVYARVKLEGTNLKIERIRTNGDLIAFTGKGNIQLDKEYVDVMLETKPLPNVLWNIIPKLLRPITKTLQINLKGNYDNLDWTPAQGLWDSKK
jgi:hypothetical protein